MKDVIVSFATKGRENYTGMLLRLIDSCIQHWKGDLLIYSPDHELNEYKGVTIHKKWPDPVGIKSYTHAEMPYQFKTALIQKAIELGYERIIWLDSSMQLKREIGSLLDLPMCFFHNLGHPTNKYLSDDAKNLLMVTEEEIMRNEQIWGGCFFLNFTKQATVNFFNELKEFSINGSFKNGNSVRNGFVSHRHDQSVMSMLLRNYKEAFIMPYGQILCPPHDITGEYGTDPYLVCRGL